MGDNHFELHEQFRRVFFTREGLLRLVIVVAAGVIVGVILGASDASSGLRTLTIIVGALLAGTILFVPAYRDWRRTRG